MSSCLLVFLEPGSVHIQVTIITIVQISFYLFLFFYIFLHSTFGTPSSILNYSLFQLSTFKKRNGRSMYVYTKICSHFIQCNIEPIKQRKQIPPRTNKRHATNLPTPQLVRLPLASVAIMPCNLI